MLTDNRPLQLLREMKECPWVHMHDERIDIEICSKCALTFEVAEEFSKLSRNVWDATADASYARLLISKRKWREFSSWWIKTTHGKKKRAEWQKTKKGRAWDHRTSKAYRERRNKLFVDLKCEYCGKPFTQGAYNHHKKPARFCSAACNAKARGKKYFVDGKFENISNLSKKYGIPAPTIRSRIRLGFLIEEAVGQRRQKPSG